MEEEEEFNFDFQEFSMEDLNPYDGKGGWSTGSLDDFNFDLDPTWLD